MLLETRLRYGIISFEENDVEVWHQRWQPSEKAVQDLGQKWESIRDAKVKFIANNAGGVNCHVFKVKESCCQRFKYCLSMTFNCMKSCVLGIYNCLKSCTLGIYHRIQACA